MTKKVLLIGSSGGIGSCLVSQLSIVGYDVFGIDKASCPGNSHELTLINSYHGAISSNTVRANGTFESYKKQESLPVINVDLNEPDDVLETCEKLRELCGELWAIIFNAGIYPIVSLEDYSLDLWDEVNNVNVKAAFILLKNLHPLIISGGRIVTIVSGAAYLGSRDVGYSASKASLLGLTRSLALNLSKQHILVNAVFPGVIETPMSDKMPANRVKEYKKRILLNRFGQPSEVSIAVEFLLNPRNTYMTGSVIDINGGLYLR